MAKPVLVGAVLYDPKVVTIWEIIARFFEGEGVPMEPVFYKDYDLQVDALRDGKIDVAWNSPLAWLDSVRKLNGACRAIAMRDTDRDRETVLLARVDGPATLQELEGKTVAFGASDSPQATLIPQGVLALAGVRVTPQLHEIGVGLHGDHVGGERDALESLKAGRADASWALDLNWQLWSSDGTANPGEIREIARTPRFDHCVFTVRDDFPAEVEGPWLEALHRMSYDNPEHREMMDMEGLKAWMPGRTTGFEALENGIRATGFW